MIEMSAKSHFKIRAGRHRRISGSCVARQKRMNNPPLKLKGSQEPTTTKDMSRRCFVRTTVATTAATLARLRTHAAGPRPVLQTALGPEAALNELMEGNQRYVSGNMTAH